MAPARAVGICSSWQGRVFESARWWRLLADTRKGNRPSFTDPEQAEPLVEASAAGLEAAGVRVERGVFGASMQVSLVNDGPVTIVVDGPSPRQAAESGG